MALKKRRYSAAQVQMRGVFPLRFQRFEMGRQRETEEHTHAFCEIGLSLGGGAVHLHDGLEQALEPGSIYILTPGESHALRVPQSWTVQNIYYSPELFSREYGAFLSLPRLMGLFFHRELFGSPGVPCFRLTPAVFAQIETILELAAPDADVGEKPALEDPRDGGTPAPALSGLAAPIVLRSLFTALLVLVAEDHSRQFPDHPAFTMDGRIVAALAAVENLLEGPARDVVPAVGDALGMTREYASSFFHAKTGSTIRDYVLRRRVLRACPLLLEGRSVTAVAHELGFWDTPHFTRSFRKILGCAPRDYREHLQSGYGSLDSGMGRPN